MKFQSLFGLAALASTACAVSLGKLKNEHPVLDVTLTRKGNTEVGVSIRNNEDVDLLLFNEGNILDESDTEKLQIHQRGAMVDFHGMHKSVMTDNPTEEAVTRLGAGETLDFVVDAGALHDLRNGGRFEVEARGVILYTTKLSDGFQGEAQYASNTLIMHIDGDEAAQALYHGHDLRKRMLLQADCTGDLSTAMTSALKYCKSLAYNSNRAALFDDVTRMTKYFGSGETDIARDVSTRYRAIFAECGSASSGSVTTFCNSASVSKPCGATTIAYAFTNNTIVTCAPFWGLNPYPNICRGYDQATVLIHELTHSAAVYTPPTSDYAYSYAACTGSALQPDQKLRNGNNYLYYSNSVALGGTCD